MKTSYFTKLFSIILCIVTLSMYVVSLPVLAKADSIPDDYLPNTDFIEYYYDSQEKETQTGFSYHLSNGKAVLTAYNGNETSVVIPNKIEGYEVYSLNGTFSNHLTLKEVIIEDGIQEIDENAFFNCPNLEKVILPKSLTRIGQHAFENCILLKAISFPKTLEIIEGWAFNNTDLRKAIIPASVYYIGSYSFSNNTNLKSLVIQSSDTMIYTYAFENTALQGVLIPKAGISYCEGAFPKSAYLTDKPFLYRFYTLFAGFITFISSISKSLNVNAKLLLYIIFFFLLLILLLLLYLYINIKRRLQSRLIPGIKAYKATQVQFNATLSPNEDISQFSYEAKYVKRYHLCYQYHYYFNIYIIILFSGKQNYR